ncbi:hypothetical protein NDU88_003789 [Pleurodeles waltl]|uniref:Uncharacterized protein n=1 Tax=Pleurodeles waltl TaxID=8319 RepID=A0AAV7LGI3_PLEWA|nr:hypothetical protein NDU88_003789 [Pleurodeles waltl]
MRASIHTSGLLTVAGFTSGGVFLSQTDFVGETHDSALEGFTTRHNAILATLNFPAEPPTFQTLHIMLQVDSPQHLVPNLYHTAQEEYTAAQWEGDIGAILGEVHWKDCCVQTGQVAPSSRVRILHDKYLQRMYNTRARLHSYGL